VGLIRLDYADQAMEDLISYMRSTSAPAAAQPR
jgi:cytochrome c1